MWKTLTLTFERERTVYLEIVDRSRTGHIVVHDVVFDDSKEPRGVTHQYMREVLDRLLAGQEPPVTFVPPMGCSIKWKADHWK